MDQRLLLRSVLVLFAVTLGAGRALAQQNAPPPSWEQIEQLASDQKLEEASKGAEARLAAARAAGQDEEWARALIKVVQLRIGLHGYETAVRFLKEQPWPKSALPRSALDVYYAHTLVAYESAYSWEIRGRERVASQGPVDLKSWTLEQIVTEANRAYLDAWGLRDKLGQAPLSAWGEYLEPNNYPPGIRSTLRDALAYLWVDLLANSSLWRPEQENELFRLDVKGLVKGNPSAAAQVKLDDPAVHPLVKVGAILDDLEAWHLGQGRREAALEARLKRAQVYNGAFSEEEDRALVRQDLESRLPSFRDVPWWAMGMDALAGLWRDAGDWVRARDIAERGAKAYPQSVGGKRCLYTVKSIEAPEYQLSAMSTDGLQKRTLLVTHKNLKALYLRAYRFDVDGLIASWKDYNLLPEGNALSSMVRNTRPLVEWTVELPATPDFHMHQTFVVPPLKQPGLYVIAASTNPSWKLQQNRLESVAVMISDLVLLVRQGNGPVPEARVVRGDTGQPVAGAELDIYRFDWKSGHSRIGSRATDAQGWARVDGLAPGGGYFLVARLGAQRAVDLQQISYLNPPAPTETKATLVYTDRSVYRPLQKVLWKVVAYQGRGDQARYRVTPSTDVAVTLRDANGEVVEKKTVKTNGFGSASGEFTLPAGRLLGGWRITTEPSGQANLQVEEYKRPTFETTFKEPEGPLRLNKPATLVGEARYYFGLPVTSGQVRWRVTRAPRFPWWWGEFRPGAGQTQVIATGAGGLAEDGTFRIGFTPEVDPRTAASKDIDYDYRVEADVTDEGGETRSAERFFRLGWVAVDSQVVMDTRFLLEGRGGEVTVLRTDLNGAPRPGKGTFRLVALEGPAQTLLPADQPRPAVPSELEAANPKRVMTEGDRLQPRWDTRVDPLAVLRQWTAGAQKAAGELAHDAKGEAKVKLPPLPAGAYRLEYETQDEFGAKHTRGYPILVAGARMPVALPLLAMAERSSVRAGEVARLLVTSGLPDQPILLEIRRARGTERRVIMSGKDPALIELPLGPDDRGGLSFSAVALRDWQLMSLDETVFVPFDDKELKLEFATFRDMLRPGAKETFRVAVKGPGGAKLEAGAVELLAYMYDRALDVFAPHTPPSTANLYPQHWRGGYLRSTVSQAPSQWLGQEDFPPLPEQPVLREDELKLDERYGVGGPGMRRRPGLLRLETLAVEGKSAEAMKMQKPEAAMDKVAAVNAPPPLPAPPGKPPPAQGQAEGQPVPAAQVRSNFSETAFWKPHLITAADGTAVIEFTVPDSVTSWSVWVHGITRELAGGSLQGQTRSVKELMVRPYLPRFLREGDEAALQVVLNNAAERELKGDVTFEILDADTQASLADAFGLSAADRKAKPFAVAAGKSAHVGYALKAPPRLGTVAIKVVARAGDVSDGELRPIPVLPSRVHLAQSRFATLHGNDARTLRFEDLAKNDDPSRINEQLVVTVDAQLFYSVLEALPYLANYPYECTEQTLNRFVSAGIVARLYKDYPGVARMAEQLSKRTAPLETWDAADPNRKMGLEETPWLQEARGGKAPEGGVVNVLDPRVADAERVASLEKLRKAQTAVGGFPWWPGGPPSPYMTLYLAHGLARAAEYKVDIPKDMTQRAWGYLARHFREEYAGELAQGKSRNYEFLTFLNYVVSSYPDASYTGDALTQDERKQILDFTFAHWREHSPYLKGLLALTLNRMGRRDDALKVWDSVMDSAKTTADEGTFWAPEDRSWLWYNDTTETQAFALRTLMELRPQDARREGLVQWLLLHKKLSQWKSTRATAEAIYALVKYLEQEKELGIREEVQVAVGPKTERFVFEPDQYTGKKNQVVVPGPEVDARSATVEVTKPSKGFGFASATWRFSTEKLPAEASGDFFSVTRRYFKREKAGREVVLRPLADGATLAPGDEVEVQLSLRSKQAAEYVHLRDPRAAGLEPEDTSSRYKWDLGIAWYEEPRDSGTNFFFEWLPAGEYTFRYRVRASLGGTFRVGPATVQSMYAPEFNAYSAGAVLKVAGTP